MNRITIIIAFVATMLLPAVTFAQDLALSPEAVESVIASGLGMPLLGLAAVLAAMLLGRIKDGVPLKDQALNALKSAKRPALAGLLTGGVALMAGAAPLMALGMALSVMLSAANLLTPKS
jgi:hypothetical protein